MTDLNIMISMSVLVVVFLGFISMYINRKERHNSKHKQA